MLVTIRLKFPGRFVGMGHIIIVDLQLILQRRLEPMLLALYSGSPQQKLIPK